MDFKDRQTWNYFIYTNTLLCKENLKSANDVLISFTISYRIKSF